MIAPKARQNDRPHLLRVVLGNDGVRLRVECPWRGDDRPCALFVENLTKPVEPEIGFDPDDAASVEAWGKHDAAMDEHEGWLSTDACWVQAAAEGVDDCRDQFDVDECLSGWPDGGMVVEGVILVGYENDGMHDESMLLLHPWERPHADSPSAERRLLVEALAGFRCKVTSAGGGWVVGTVHPRAEGDGFCVDPRRGDERSLEEIPRGASGATLWYSSPFDIEPL